VDFFMTVTDVQAEQAMRTLADGTAGDVPLLSGESGAAGLAGLMLVANDPALAAQAGLDVRSRILLVNTEGATAPGVYESITGHPAAEVLRAQRAWLDRATSVARSEWR
jgi:diaminopropionate ammonia-lyase